MSGNGLPPIIGESAAMCRARELIERYAPSALPILLVGATGTGKELLARHVHARSSRLGRFVAVNCGALPREMAEGLLFGYERGAFSGAVKLHRGHLECADGGTLFLDEVLSLPLDEQAKLLRALDLGVVQRLGAELERRVDLRVVAAAQQDVSERLASGAFRRDLYERVAGVIINLPPLAERPEDVVPLAAHYAAQCGRVLEPDSTRVLAAHKWPGNVRELRHVIERAGRLVGNGTLSRAALLEAIEIGAMQDDLSLTSTTRLGDVLSRIVAMCEGNGWHAGRTAVAMGVHRSTLFRRLRAHGTSFRQLRESHLLRHSRATTATLP